VTDESIDIPQVVPPGRRDRPSISPAHISALRTNFAELRQRRLLLMATLRASLDEIHSSRARLQHGSHADGAAALGYSARLQRDYGFTAREVEVAALLEYGLSNVAVAQRLGISPHTARHHTQRVLVKLGVHSRAAAAARLRA
jgi:DNA-binding CsgD family transcriptional regulator